MILLIHFPDYDIVIQDFFFLTVFPVYDPDFILPVCQYGIPHLRIALLVRGFFCRDRDIPGFLRDCIPFRRTDFFQCQVDLIAGMCRKHVLQAFIRGTDGKGCAGKVCKLLSVRPKQYKGCAFQGLVLFIHLGNTDGAVLRAIERYILDPDFILAVQFQAKPGCGDIGIGRSIIAFRTAR